MSEPLANIWFPFMIGDHLGRTQHLTPSEESVYLRLQCHQWQNGHFREDQIRIIGRLDSDAWSISRASLMQMLSMDEAGLFFLSWLEALKLKYSEKQQKAVEKARKAGNARWAKRRREQGEQGGKTMLGASTENSSSIPPNAATTMPVTFTGGKAIPPSQAQGDPPRSRRGGSDSVDKAKTPKKAQAASEATPPPLAASEPPEAHGEPLRGTLGVQSAHPMVRQAEARRPTSGDTRFHPFKGMILRWWGQANNKPPDKAAWGGRANAELKRMLEAEPSMTIDDLAERLAYRWTALEMFPTGKGSVLPSAPLHHLMSKLDRYVDGPVNDFGDKV